ncbi:unnamed protein product [Linum tenue]|uniref:Uncharacterized protein n=1 Tax=Linum tenue TaxID=586396 RepID=A0AAV0JEB8_9ROSI|nr:unnamed protein product [Linum tenue]
MDDELPLNLNPLIKDKDLIGHCFHSQLVAGCLLHLLALFPFLAACWLPASPQPASCWEWKQCPMRSEGLLEACHLHL